MKDTRYLTFFTSMRIQRLPLQIQNFINHLFSREFSVNSVSCNTVNCDSSHMRWAWRLGVRRPGEFASQPAPPRLVRCVHRRGRAPGRVRILESLLRAGR